MSLKLNQITLSLIACLVIVTLTLPAHAKEDVGIGLYVNLSTDDTVKVGHAVTYFLNGKAALIAVKGAPQASFKGKSLQDWLKTQISNGAKVLVCRVCMGLHNIKPSDLIEGSVQATPELVANYLFDPSFRTISW